LQAEEVARLLLEEAGVAGIAGAAFGAEGKDYLRFSLVSAPGLLQQALERIGKVAVSWAAPVSADT
jgi:aspartate/methionine/tyrosine aminotransferase